MRAGKVWLVLMTVGAGAGAARADKTTDELQAGYEKEAAACATQAGGVAKVADGAARLQASLVGAEHDALDADVAKLAKGKTLVDAYCAELATALDLLHGNPGARYKALERQLDEHDNKIRRARADSKRAIGELEPVIRALVPRINARAAPAQPAPDKRAPAKFPSGRSVVLPVLAGSWRMSGTPTSDTADYTEGKLAASIWTKPFEGATCEQEKRVASGADEARPSSEAAKAIGVAWLTRGAVHGAAPRATAFACVPGGAGGWMGFVTIEGTAAPAATRDALDELMIAMLAAQKR